MLVRSTDQGDARRPAYASGAAPTQIAARIAVLTLIALTTANCTSNVATRGGKSGNKYGVSASPKVIADGEPVPKGGGREMVGKPYRVGDRTYVPHAGRGYVREGEASWYGTAFHGRLTANGEIFDKESIAAAHPTLPLPSYVRVTNLGNHRSMIVRVNDRGPYERGRLLDLSERAADALEFRRAGTTKVRVEYVGRASVQGSDDRKLLATLRSDGAPASLGQRGPVMLAALDEGGAPTTPAPLAFKPANPRPAAKASDVIEERVPAPVVLASRAVNPAPRPEERVAPAAPAAVAHPVRAASPPLAPPRPNPVRLAQGNPDGSLDLATIPGAARPAPVSPHRASAPVELLPPERPVLAGLYYADPGRRRALAEPSEPFAKLDRRRVVSLKHGFETNAAQR